MDAGKQNILHAPLGYNKYNVIDPINHKKRFIDQAKAFESTDRHLLFYKLDCMSIRNTARKRFKSSLLRVYVNTPSLNIEPDKRWTLCRLRCCTTRKHSRSFVTIICCIKIVRSNYEICIPTLRANPAAWHIHRHNFISSSATISRTKLLHKSTFKLRLMFTYFFVRQIFNKRDKSQIG